MNHEQISLERDRSGPAAGRAEIKQLPQAARPGLTVIDLLEFMGTPEPEREFIVEPFIRERNLVQFAARRGDGKTFINLALALAIASGSPLLGFEIDRPRRVLFAEPEMDGRELQDRIKLIQMGLINSVQAEYFRLACHAKNPNGLFNLATPEGCAKLDAHLGDAEVIFLDSKKYLCHVRDENSADGYEHFHRWLMRQRYAGRTVIMSTHMGKSANGARGSSAQEDLLDVCVQLSRTQTGGKGLHALWEFTKGRGLSAKDQESFTVELRVENDRAELLRAGACGVEENGIRMTETMLQLHLQGFSQQKIAQQLGVNQSTVSRKLNDLENLKRMHAMWKNEKATE